VNPGFGLNGSSGGNQSLTGHLATEDSLLF
jgi:hypothetical protein